MQTTLQTQLEANKYKYLINGCLTLRFILGALIIIIGMDFFVEGKFFVDSMHIYDLYQNIGSGSIFDIMKLVPYSSFQNTAVIYRILLFNQNLSFNIFVYFSSLIYCLLFTLIIKNIDIKYNKNIFPFFLLLFVFDMIYLLQPSKELISLFLSFIVFKLILSDIKIRDLLILLAVSIYAIFFREYYFIILILFYAIRLLIKSNIRVRVLLLISFFIGLFIMFYYTKWFDQVIFLRQTSSGFLKGFTNTLIQDVFPLKPGERNLFKFLANYIVIALRMLFPVEILWKSPSRGVIFFPIQMVVNYIVFNYLFKIIHYRKMESLHEREYEKNSRIVIYIVSFFLTSVLFEPDFGSVFRHNLNLLPFILYLSFGTRPENGRVRIHRAATVAPESLLARSERSRI